MDATVEQLGVVVIDALRAADYMESTIGQYEKTVRYLREFAADCGEVVYTPALGARFAAMTTSPRTGRFSVQRRFSYGRLVSLFDGYLDTGVVDLSVRGRGGGGPQPGCDDFVALDAAWEADMKERGLAPATRSAYGRVARGYLTFLESRGNHGLREAEPASVLAFLESLSTRWAASSLYWAVSNFRPFLKFTGRADLVEAVGLARVRRSRRILPVLDDQDQAMVVHACTSGVVCARDAAITLLALTTGLRACDLVGLRLGDIDWRAGTIGIVQQKTGNPLMLPLPPLVSAKLAEYVLDQRPDSDDDHVFLRAKAPHTGLADHASIYQVTATTFRAAGVSGVKVGTSVLRHSAASRLLRAATPLPTISAVLGHADPNSTNVYLSVDRERLLECVLPVPAGARP
ncbi:tyrosine-type recombinase/integrase [Segeticoccus rhizosphaerae]|jgi:integrase|uniref:tyrosine-type recombinase/integrase n=1 Tax=Segeticoccus rhizosphaerae TaxID=1104777 RepID=UPI0010C07AC5|nr:MULTISPECIES: tyrosine-type recombinase/integrase [Intrasporangiaceae]